MKYGITKITLGSPGFIDIFIIKQACLNLISKMRSDGGTLSSLEDEYSGMGCPAKHGEKIDVRKPNAKYLEETSIEDHLRTDIYQGRGSTTRSLLLP